MFQQWLSAHHAGDGALAALLLFLLVFVAVLAHTFLGPRRGERWQHLARLPFDEEDGDAAASAPEKGNPR